MFLLGSVSGTVAAKKAGPILMSVAAFFGVAPENAPMVLSIFLGLSSGTAMAWFMGIKRKDVERMSRWMWIGETIALWVTIVLLILATHELSSTFFGYEIQARVSGGLAVIMAYMRADILNALARRTKNEIAERGRSNNSD